MLGQWRLTLRQAEEAARSERFEEALELARRPEVADHRKAWKLRDQIALRLIERAREHARCGHSQAAWHDLRQAELAGAPAGKLESARSELIEQGLAEVRAYLDAADPVQAAALADKMRLQGADSAEFRRLGEAAVCWERGERAAQLGEFGRAIERLEIAGKHLVKHTALEQQLLALRGESERAAALRAQLQGSLASQDWAGVLKAADSFLELAPDCREVRKARDEALRRLGVQGVSTTYVPPKDMQDTPLILNPGEVKNGSRGRFILWIDGVAGYLVCLGPVVTVGQATPGCAVDIPIFGDLSRLHATFVRDGEGYLVRSERELWVNGRPTKHVALRHGDLIRLGPSVQLRFWMPCPVSETARLELVSRHRLHLSLAGILLMAETCVLGPTPQAHVQVPQAAGQVVLYRQGDGLWCRADGILEIDGHAYQGRGPLRLSSRAAAGELSFSLEPLGSPLNQV